MAEAIMPEMEAPPPPPGEPVVQLPEHQQEQQQQQEEEELNNPAPIQVIIDSDMEDEEEAAEAHFKRNGGLPYDDHNYGNLEKKKLDEVDSDYEGEFPVIGPLDEFLNILPITPPQPVYHQPQQQQQQQHPHSQHIPSHQIFVHQRQPGTIQFQKQYTAQYVDHPRSEPSIVARAPAREGGIPTSYRITTETASGGYQQVTRTILPQSRQIMRPRAELSQSGQPVYSQSPAHHVPGSLRATPTTTIAAGTIPRRPPTQQQQQPQQQHQQQQPGQPGAYQHIVNSTPTGSLIRRSIPTGRGPSILAANRTAVAAGDHHFSPQTPGQRRIVDVAPHRMTQEQRILQQQQAVSQVRPLTVTNTQSPSTQFTNLEGVAPMLVPARGSKLLVRGRAGSHGQRRREDGGDFQSPPPSSSDSGSPRKMVPGDTPSTEEPHLLSPSKLAMFGAVKPPHRMTQEEKNAHIAKHLEKDKIPAVPMPAAAQAILENSARSTDENVASVVLAVAEAVNAANLNSGEARPSTIPTPSTSATSYHAPASNAQVDKKEKEEITKLANDIRISCESFVQTPKSSQVLQNGDSDQQNNDVIRVKHHIENAKRELEEEANIVGPGGKVDGRKQRASGYGANVMIVGTPDQPARQRGRPKGSTGARSRWSTSSNQQEAPTPPGNVVRLGQGVRTMPAQLPPTPLHQMQQSHVLAQHQSPMLIPPTPQHQPPQQQHVVEKDSDSESDGINKQGEQDYGDSWTMRCHCEMDHGEGDCVECEKCGDWQHMACMGLKPNDPLDGYQCEICVPRHLKLSKAEAAKIQRKELERMKKLKPKTEKRGRKSQSKETGKRRSSTNKTPTPLYTDANEYSRTSLRLLKTLSSTSGAAGLLMDAKNKIRARRMFVLENVEGLVSVEPVDSREVIIELSGYVCRPDEANREPGGVPGIYQYDGLLKGPQGEEVGQSSGGGSELICVDAKKKGNDAKYTRRSCTPNCVLKHVLDDRGILGVMIVATRFVAYNTEITLPFDNDWAVRKTKLVCAEHFGEESTMCPYEIQRAKKNPPELVPTQPKLRPDAFEHILREEGEHDDWYREPVRQEKPVKVSRKSEKVEPVAPKKVEKMVEVVKKAEPVKELREEAEKKEDAKAKMTPGSSKKAQKAAKRASMEMSPPARKSSTPKEESEKKLSREERRTQQYEKLFSRQEEEEKRRQSKSNKKESKTPTTAEKEKSKSVEREKTPAPVTEKRSSARVSAAVAAAKTAESTPTRELSARQKDKKKRLESEAESEASVAPVPPVKRWKAEAAREATAAAASFKKQWMKRHNAESTGASSSSPTKKPRRTSVEQPRFTYRDLLGMYTDNAKQMAKVQMDFDISHIRTKDDKVSRKCLNMQEEFKRQADEKERRHRREKRESEREEAEKKAEQEEIKQETIKEEVEPQVMKEEIEATTSTVEKVEEVEEAKKVTKKRLSMAEYKMRKPTVGQNESKDDQKPSSSQGVGFIPSTEGASGHTISFPQLPPLVAQASPDKRHHYDAPSTSSGDPRLRHHAPPPPPPPPRASQTQQTPPASSPSRFAGASFTTSADDSPQHTMSLKDRLFTEFGLGQEQTPAPTAPPAQPSTRARSTRWQ